MRFYSSRLAVGALVISVGLGTGQALAADADATGKALVAAFGAVGNVEASYTDASANGDDVTINEFKLAFGKKTMTVPALVVTGVAERDKGGFTAKSISFDGGSVTGAQGTTKWETASIEDAIVPSPEEIKAKPDISPFSKGSVAKINLSAEGMPATVDIDQLDVTMSVADDGAMTFSSGLNGIKVPLALFPEMAGVFAAMGYTDAFDINIAIDSGYERGSDTTDVRSFTIDTANVGKLGIDAKINGISLTKMVEDRSAEDLQSKLKLESFHLRFDNAGVVEKVLDMQAKQAGMQRAEIVSQFTGALPLLLNFIGNEAFQGKIATAVTAFLNDPKSITLSAAPSTPVAFDAIANAVAAAPQTVPDLVGADISANN